MIVYNLCSLIMLGKINLLLHFFKFVCNVAFKPKNFLNFWIFLDKPTLRK